MEITAGIILVDYDKNEIYAGRISQEEKPIKIYKKHNVNVLAVTSFFLEV